MPRYSPAGPPPMQAIFTRRRYQSYARTMKTLLCAIALVACGHHEDPARPAGATFEVTSTAFGAGAAIPIEHTCEGADTAPPLAWSGAPAATTSFAVIVDDPDAPGQTWVHWVVVNLPGNATSVAAGATM